LSSARIATALATVALLASTLIACGSDEQAAENGAEDSLLGAADLSTCRDDANPAGRPYGDAFPEDWPFPPETVVFNAEDRGSDGTIVTGISSAPFKQILAFMNQNVVDRGYKIEKGETEEHDAEAEWQGNGFRGRWAIRESAQCQGQTVIQVVAATE
jgi:hypothetical protein